MNLAKILLKKLKVHLIAIGITGICICLWIYITLNLQLVITDHYKSYKAVLDILNPIVFYIITPIVMLPIIYEQSLKIFNYNQNKK